MSKNRYRREHPEDELTAEEQAFLNGEQPKEDGEDEGPAPNGLLAPEDEGFKKRYGDLRRHSQQQEAKLKARIAELEASSGNKQMPKTKEEVEEWVKTYPDLAGILRTIMREEIGTNAPKDDSALKRVQELEGKLEKAEAYKILMRLHPDFDEIRNDEKFHAWAKKQSKLIQDALYNSLDPYACADAVRLYKVDAGITTKAPKSQDNRSAATSVSRSTASAPSGEEIKWTESKVAKLSERDYEKHEKEIDEAIRSGKFVYDLSGGAR